MKKTGYIFTIITTVLAAVVLIFVANRLSAHTAEEHDAEKFENAMRLVYSDAQSFDTAVFEKKYLDRYLDDNGFSPDKILIRDVIYARNDQNNVQGTVVNITVLKKFGGVINLLAGVRNDGTVNGYSILEITDAKGLEMKVKEEEFSSQFEDVLTDKFILVEKDAVEPNEIVKASGAEDASEAVVTAVNAAILANDFMAVASGGIAG